MCRKDDHQRQGGQYEDYVGQAHQCFVDHAPQISENRPMRGFPEPWRRKPQDANK